MNSQSCSTAHDSSRCGRLFVISAPSGAGKDTVLGCLIQLCPDIVLSVSVTTRPPRAGEIDGVSYYFVSKAQFEDMIISDEFLEYACYAGEYYGTLKKPIEAFLREGKDVLLEIEVQGAKQIMSILPEAVTIFIVPPSLEELERRLRGRGTDSEKQLAVRLKTAEYELMEKTNYDHIVVNEDVSRAAEEIMSIICR